MKKVRFRRQTALTRPRGKHRIAAGKAVSEPCKKANIAEVRTLIRSQRSGGELPRENSIRLAQKIETARLVGFLSSMYSMVFQGESFGVPMVPLVAHRSVFQTTPVLLTKRCHVQSRVSFGRFVGARRGTEPAIADDTARDLGLSSELKFTTASTAVADWRAVYPSHDADTALITASLDGRLRSQARVV